MIYFYIIANVKVIVLGRFLIFNYDLDAKTCHSWLYVRIINLWKNQYSKKKNSTCNTMNLLQLCCLLMLNKAEMIYYTDTVSSVPFSEKSSKIASRFNVHYAPIEFFSYWNHHVDTHAFKHLNIRIHNAIVTPYTFSKV